MRFCSLSTRIDGGDRSANHHAVRPPHSDTCACVWPCLSVCVCVCDVLRFCKRARLSDGQVVIFAHGELSGNHKPLSVRAGDRTVVVPIVNVSTLNLPPPDDDGQPQPGPAKVEFRKFMAGVHKFVVNGGAGNDDRY